VGGVANLASFGRLKDVGASLQRPSLVRRLIALAAAWSLVLLVVAGVSLSAFFTNAVVNRFDDDLSQTIDGLVAGASAENGQVIGPRFSDPRAMRAYSGEYWEIAEAGPNGGLQALARSRSLWDRALAPPSGGAAVFARDPGKAIYYNATGPLGQRLRVAALQGRLPDAPQPVIFMAAEDRAPIDKDAARFDTTVGVFLLLLGAGLLAAVVFQVRFGLQPLFALQREVAEVRTGRSDRLSGRYPVELDPLATELNALVAHNQEVVERQRTHVGNLAHALKTPLSVVLTEARSEPGRLSDVVIRQADTMSQQIDHHLRRARAAARASGQGERTEVAPVLEELSRTLERIFRDKVSEIDWRCDDGLCFAGERHDLLEVAGNLLENACKWAKSRVRVSAWRTRDGRLQIVVEDDGPGLAADKRAEVLRRGARLDESAPGSGLGLSIVDELARAYRGSVALGVSALSGLKVDVVLPRAE
jgi:signal transduction histidine kinase